jgi:p-cumate 2,3-dioxygenase alpha subunit
MSQLPSPLIVDDRENGAFRVNRDTMTSQLVHAQEMRRVFERSWLYVGHESELDMERLSPNGALSMVF